MTRSAARGSPVFIGILIFVLAFFLPHSSQSAEVADPLTAITKVSRGLVAARGRSAGLSAQQMEEWTGGSPRVSLRLQLLPATTSSVDDGHLPCERDSARPEDQLQQIASGDPLILIVHNEGSHAAELMLAVFDGDGETNFTQLASSDGTWLQPGDSQPFACLSFDKPGTRVLRILGTTTSLSRKVKWELEENGRMNGSPEPGADDNIAMRVRNIAKLWIKAELPQLLFSPEQRKDAALLLVGDDSAENQLGLLPSGYPTGSRILLYWEQDEQLLVSTLGEDGISEPMALGISPADLDLKSNELIWSLGIQRNAAKRAARRKGTKRSTGLATFNTSSTQSSDDLVDELSALLFPPQLHDYLEGMEHLVVLPAGSISVLPLSMMKPTGTSPLVESASLSMAPSLHSILLAMDPWNGTFEQALVVGDPKPLSSSQWRFPALPGARTEATNVARYMDTLPMLGRAASAENALSAVTSADLLYFATHGVADPEDPMFGSFLALGGRGKLEPWTAVQIASVDLTNTRLAVLSACQTGLGKIHEGGTIGLARAFHTAGVNRVVVSLWNVDDQATSKLMSRFAEALASEPPAQALRTAMLETRKEFPDPALWSSFLLFGTPR